MLFGNKNFNPAGGYPGGINYNFGKGTRDWGSMLGNVQKTLGIVNQALPIINQLRPILNNAKTMFKVMSEFKRLNNTNSVNTSVNANENKEISDANPNFFI